MTITVSHPYQKPWLDHASQVRRLIERGLLISDLASAEHFLSYCNYYRFTGYALKFQAFDTCRGERLFESGVRFEDIADLYFWDRDLRDCILYGLEMVEVGFRTSLAYSFGRSYGAFGYLDKNRFIARFSDPSLALSCKTPGSSRYDEWYRGLIKEVERSNELFIKHFKKTYQEYPNLPIWVVAEIASFGSLSLMYSNMLKTDMKDISHVFRLQPGILDSWMHVFVYVRNVCAHHGRLWDKNLSISPQLPPGKKWDCVRLSSQRIYSVAMMLNEVLSSSVFCVAEVDSWRKKLETLMDRFLERFSFLMPYTGFPCGWKEKAVWSSGRVTTSSC